MYETWTRVRMLATLSYHSRMRHDSSVAVVLQSKQIEDEEAAKQSNLIRPELTASEPRNEQRPKFSRTIELILN